MQSRSSLSSSKSSSHPNGAGAVGVASSKTSHCIPLPLSPPRPEAEESNGKCDVSGHNPLRFEKRRHATPLRHKPSRRIHFASELFSSDNGIPPPYVSECSFFRFFFLPLSRCESTRQRQRRSSSPENADQSVRIERHIFLTVNKKSRGSSSATRRVHAPPA